MSSKKNSRSANSSSLILSGVATEDNFLNHEVISSMDVHVSKELFLSFPDSDDVVSQLLNTWKNRNAKDLSDPKVLAI